MQSLGEAIRQGGAAEKENVDTRIEKALSCPCVADLRTSSCGKYFDAALACFIRNEEYEDLAGRWLCVALAAKNYLVNKPT